MSTLEIVLLIVVGIIIVCGVVGGLLINSKNPKLNRIGKLLVNSANGIKTILNAVESTGLVGKEKKFIAMAKLREYFADKGIDISQEDISKIIEDYLETPQKHTKE